MVKAQADITEKKMIKVEAQIENINENMMEQKVATKEVREDTKAILKLLMENR